MSYQHCNEPFGSTVHLSAYIQTARVQHDAQSQGHRVGQKSKMTYHAVQGETEVDEHRNTFGTDDEIVKPYE